MTSRLNKSIIKYFIAFLKYLRYWPWYSHLTFKNNGSEQIYPYKYFPIQMGRTVCVCKIASIINFTWLQRGLFNFIELAVIQFVIHPLDRGETFNLFDIISKCINMYVICKFAYQYCNSYNLLNLHNITHSLFQLFH